jgi:hypothetical protein
MSHDGPAAKTASSPHNDNLRIWYDETDRRLRRAMRSLRRRQIMLERSEKPVRRRHAFHILWAGAVGWIIILLGISGIIDLPVELLTFTTAAFGIVIVPFMVFAWPLITRWRLRRLLRRLTNGKIGYAIMTEKDRVWLILDAAMKAHGLTMHQAFKRTSATRHIAAYLEAIQRQRVILRAYDNKRIEMSGVVRDALESIQSRAKLTAERIATRRV